VADGTARDLAVLDRGKPACLQSSERSGAQFGRDRRPTAAQPAEQITLAFGERSCPWRFLEDAVESPLAGVGQLRGQRALAALTGRRAGCAKSTTTPSEGRPPNGTRRSEPTRTAD
jgi:hypothetical protein